MSSSSAIGFVPDNLYPVDLVEVCMLLWSYGPSFVLRVKGAGALRSDQFAVTHRGRIVLERGNDEAAGGGERTIFKVEWPTLLNLTVGAE